MRAQRQALTLLQRGVIHRLRDAGFEVLADAANDAWSYGERCQLPNMVSVQDGVLRADFVKADGQVQSSPERND